MVLSELAKEVEKKDSFGPCSELFCVSSPNFFSITFCDANAKESVGRLNDWTL